MDLSYNLNASIFEMPKVARGEVKVEAWTTPLTGFV